MNSQEGDKLYFHLGSYGPGFIVELRGDGLWQCSCCPDKCAQEEVQIENVGQRWRGFWQIIERENIWAWQPCYENVDVLDGTWWSLKLRHEGQSLTSEGLNAYPGDAGPEYSAKGPFARFLRALEQLVGPKLPTDGIV